MTKLTATLEKISLKDIAGILLGSLIGAAAIQFILVPAHLLTGGLSGISIILYFITSQPIWLWYVVLNIPIFIAGFKFVSRRFTLYSLIGTLSFSGFLALFASLEIKIPINDILISALLGGIISGFGVGLTLMFRGSSGGLDIIAGIFHKRWGIDFGNTILVTNLVVLTSGLITSSVLLILYSAMSIFASAKVVNSVTSGFRAKKTVMIISHNSKEIADAILHQMKRGCTLLLGSGAYTGQTENIIMVTVGKTQLPRMKEMIFVIDPQAFLTITDTVEVYGRGFRPWDKDDA
ncbi:MAG: YitT family protein [Syntrophomonadaceae bacterium]|jgi:uncharacterized membrane-anchored protein YitT (DUF2179 family)